jgi:hypothetical protein
VHDDLSRPGRRGGGDVDRTQSVPLREQQLAGTDVLADRAHVLVRRDRGHDLGCRTLVVDLLSHHHGVESVGDRITGVDHDVPVRRQLQRRGRRRPVGLLGADRDSVHRCQVARWGRAGRPHRLRGHPTERVGDRHRDRLEARGTAGGEAGAEPRGDGVGSGHVADERALGAGTAHEAILLRRVMSTA